MKRQTAKESKMITRLFLMMAILSGQAVAQYPPLREYMMPRDAEIALAKSAAPANISDHATVRVLTASGYEVVHQGNNGFVCMVMRGWAAPTYTPTQFRNLVYDATVRAPICFDPAAAPQSCSPSGPRRSWRLAKAPSARQVTGFEFAGVNV